MRLLRHHYINGLYREAMQHWDTNSERVVRIRSESLFILLLGHMTTVQLLSFARDWNGPMVSNRT